MKLIIRFILTLFVGSPLYAQTAITNPDPFVTVWRITEAPDTITILSADFGYDFDINWGDGTTETINGNNPVIEHAYADTGNYTVEINGMFPHMSIDEDDAEKLMEVSSWGDIRWYDMTGMFENAVYVQITATDAPDLSQATSMSRMFKRAFYMGGDISHWDVSTITDMSNLFESAVTFDQDISSWDVSSVTNFSMTFYNARNFNQNLNTWDVSAAENMQLMFQNAIKFNSDISDWDVSSVTNFQLMFAEAPAFNQDIGDWDVSSGTSFTKMFSRAVAFNQDIGNWDVSSGTIFQGMFNGASSFNQDISEWDVSNAYNIANIFRSAESFDQNIGKWDVSGVSSIFDVLTNAELSIENYDSLLVGWSKLPELFNNVNFNGGRSKYSSVGAVARQKIIDDFGWTFTDGGLADSTSVSNEVDKSLSAGFSLEQNYPNPFNPSTNIEYSIPVASKVAIDVYNLTGQKVASLVNGTRMAGKHSVRFDASGLSSGIYIYRIQAGEFNQTKRMTLIK
ncbi:MAG: BspA family leucine-rich repeat surface protein [bacterium]|nr:BspA family leucine-rich repeat surface protein [bacterium]